MATIIKRIFRRKNKVPLACSEIPLEELDNHVHTEACFLDVQPLTVVELFQSQGCKICVKNVPNIHDAVAGPNLAFLTYNVTYFDRAEWQDTQAARQWDSRQRAYVTKWGRKTIFTPQIVADGVSDGTGQSVNDALGVIDKARRIRSERGWNILLDSNDTDLRIDSDRAESPPMDILLCFYESGTQVVKIGKGVNKGKKLKHQNQVKLVQKIGEWNGGNLTLPLPSIPEANGRGWTVLAIVQEPSGGPIVAAHFL